jgi:hypothetical protein
MQLGRPRGQRDSDQHRDTRHDYCTPGVLLGVPTRAMRQRVIPERWRMRVCPRYAAYPPRITGNWIIGTNLRLLAEMLSWEIK